MTDTQPPTCGHPVDGKPCGVPATDLVDTGDETYPVCTHHLEMARVEGWQHVGSLTGGTTTYGPDLHGDNLAGHQAARQAIESALTTMPTGTGTRTVEAKAGHIHAQLVAKGWHLAKPDPGHDLVQVGPDEQVITVPAGHIIDVVPTTPTFSYADNELDTLAGIVAQLEGLDPESRERVAGFVTHRYGPVTPVPVGRPSWLDVTRPPGHDLPLRTGGVIGRPQATRISE